MMNTWKNLSRELARVLGNLCARYDEQENYLKQIGTFPSLDELALEFDDVYINLNVQRNPYSIDADLLDILMRINSYLEEKSGNKGDDFWDINKADQSAWETLRTYSREALGKLQNIT